MVASAVLALLAALGIVLLVWVVTGTWLLPAGGTGYTVLFIDGSSRCRRQIRGYLFLLRAGLSRLPLYLVDCGLPAEDRVRLRYAEQDSGWIRLYSAAEWAEFRETERENSVLGT